jgi:hypothetical protein
MKRADVSGFLRVAIVLTFLAALPAGAASPAEILPVRLDERRLDPGQRTVIVSVYAAAEGGVPIATETRSVVVTSGNTLDMPLGQLAGAGQADETRWVAVRVPPGVESRRVALAPASSGTRNVTVHVVPQAAITAPGLVESSVLGFRFPDGSVQTSAATVTGGVPSVNGITGAVTIAGAGTATVQTAASTITVTTPSFGSPVAVGAANAAGVATTMARSDHVHAHGNQNATTSTAGFMSAADKQTLDDAVVYVRTVVVSPVAGDPIASGTALVAALAGITGNSAASPYLVKIEPGNYDIDAAALTMKTFVDVEGSGENTTFITASRGNTSAVSTAAAVISAASSELRSLTVTNTAPGSLVGIGVFANTASRLRNVTINSTGATTTSIGIFATAGASLTISDAAITATSTGTTSGSFGLQLSSTGKATVLKSTITAKGVSGTGTNTAVTLGNASAAVTIEGCTILATGTANQNNGVAVAPGTATIMNSTIQVETAGTRIAVSTSGSASSVMNVYHSRLLATGGANNSLMSASKGANSILRIAASQIDSVSAGVPKCVHVYNSDMDDLNNVCPGPIA